MEKKKDIFDRLMALPGLRIFEPFYTRHKEALLYLGFGGFTTVLNVVLFAWLDTAFQMNELVNNVLCWIICVLFQFFTNRTWVFDGQVEGARAFLRQMAGFFGGRLLTLGIEEVLLAVFITWLALPTMPVKLAAQVVVIVLNYVISKLWIFRGKNQ